MREMFYNRWEFWMEIIKIIFTLIGALWIYRKYKKYNEDEAKLELDVDIKNLGTDNHNNYLLELEATIINKGKVREKIPMTDFSFKLLSHNGKKFNNDKSIFNQIKFDKVEELDKVLWVNPDAQCPNDYVYINGETQQVFRYYYSVSNETEYALLISRINFFNDEKEYQSAQRVIKLSKTE